MAETYRYDLYQDNNYCMSVTHFDDAIHLLLKSQLLDRNTNYKLNFIIIRDNYAKCDSYYCILNDRLVRKSYITDDYTIYSPSDTEMFRTTENYLLFNKLINKQQVNQNIQVNPVTPVNQETNQQIIIPVNQVQQKNLNEKVNIKDIIASCNNITNKILNDKKIDREQDDNNSIHSSQCHSEISEYIDDDVKSVSSINTTEMKELEEQLDLYIEAEKLAKTDITEMNDIQMDLECDINFNKKMERKEQERIQEKKNILRSDISIYFKIKENNRDIPPLFTAKYYILDYLYINEYFNNTITNVNNEEDFEDIYKLYNVLYSSMYVKDYEVPENYNNLINDFIEYLPDEEILSERQIMINENKKSDIIASDIDLINYADEYAKNHKES